MSDVVVRHAHPDEWGAVAELRWQWEQGKRRAAAMAREEFVSGFVAWAHRNRPTHRCLVAARDGVVIGMAWLAIVPRVPHPRALDRAGGDVQCVYVVPQERDCGVGGQLIEAVLTLARDLGLERVTVHSSGRAVDAYRRGGFAVSPRLLQADLAGRSR